MQWYLCEAGARVISVDRARRAGMSLRTRARYRVRGVRASDIAPVRRVLREELAPSRRLPRAVARLVRDVLDTARVREMPQAGEVVVYDQDMSDLVDIPSDSVDVVVSVSALEHNPPDELPDVVRELRRVLRPGGKLLATLGAAPDRDWFHEPSQGWCYTEASLRRIFGIDPSVPSNFERYSALFSELRSSAVLRDNLSRFYFKSGDNGMPWGIWNPQYQPVGVATTKRPAG